MDAIYPYVKSEAVFDCPSNSAKGGLTKYKVGTHDKYGSYSSNYSYYATGDSFDPPMSLFLFGGGVMVPVNISKIAAPSTTAWASENGYGLRDSVGGPCFTEYPQPYGLIGATPVIQSGATLVPVPIQGEHFQHRWPPRHLSTMNVLYTDGHVKALTVEALMRNTDGTACTSSKVCSAFTIQDD